MIHLAHTRFAGSLRRGLDQSTVYFTHALAGFEQA
jgi:hypothetical protein